MHLPGASTQVRSDIQGLRGVSILLVLLFHADDRLMPAGFFGVDVFFVVSGFVITLLLMREHDSTGSIHLGNFLARRIRRLLPNATLVLIAVLFAGALVYPSFEYAALVRDVFSAAIYVSNFHFANEAVDYFTSNRAASAVIHFWSLSVEEQFYLVWPALFATIAWAAGTDRFRAALRLVLVVTIVSSFALCLYLGSFNQPLAFFHTASRAWQLGAGALAALMVFGRAAPFTRAGGPLATLGLAVVLLSAFFVPEDETPGFATLLPVAGTVVLLVTGAADGRGTFIARLLGLRPLTWLGDRSYSLYLWHWPVLVFGKRFLGESWPYVAALVVVSIIIAEVAYRFVETPVRQGKLFPKQVARQVLAGGFMIASVFAAAPAIGAAASHLADSSTQLWSIRVAEAERDRGDAYADNCHAGADDIANPPCLYGSTNAPRAAILIGDSHAAHWLPALQSAAKQQDWRVYSWSKSLCPAANIRVWDPYKKAPYSTCDEWRSRILTKLAVSEEKFLVFLSSSNDYSGWMADPSGEPIADIRAAARNYVEGLEDTSRILLAAGHQVVIIRDTPLAEVDYKECIVRTLGGSGCERPREKAVKADAPELEVAAAIPAVQLIDVTDMICGATACPVVKDGTIIYRDDSHMTAAFARTLSDPIGDAMARASAVR